MKKNLIKGILLIVLSVVLIGANSVFAADTSGVDELLNFDETPTTTTETKKEEVTTGNSSVYNNTTTPTPTTTTTTTKTETKTEDKTLSKTGIEDTLPMVALIAVFGISAIFAFKKIKEYKNV